jgi:hypothetical protein
MMTAEEAAAHIGDGVVYRPRGARHSKAAEDGVITSVRGGTVFVRYASQHPAAGGQATDPADLTLLAPRTSQVNPARLPRVFYTDPARVPTRRDRFRRHNRTKGK